MAMAKARGFEHEPDQSEPSISKLKKRAAGKKMYGETSHFWKSHIRTLKEHFPNAMYAHLVRDGRDVTRSFYCATQFFQDIPGDAAYRNPSLPIEGFDKMNRFEKICWYWKYWNEIIEKETSYLVRLEDMNIALANNSYKKAKKWTPGMEQTFQRICGELNKKYGYK